MILDFIFLTITYAGGYLVVIEVTLLASLSFLIHKHRGRILPLLISVVGSAVTVFLLKFIFDTARPIGSFYMENTPSFPSGHAAIAIALYGFLFYVIWHHEKHPLKNKTLLLLALLVTLIGVSRIYLGVHYVPDVLVGYLIGLGWLCISVGVSKSKFLRLPDNGRL